MTEILVPLVDVIAWCRRAGRDVAMRTLLQCELDDGESENLRVIEGVEFSAESEPVAFILEDGARVLAGRLRAAGAAIVEHRPGAPLAAAVEAGRTGPEREARAQAQALAKFGVDAAMLGTADARTAVLKSLQAVERSVVPDPTMRQAAYDAFKNAGQQIQRLGAQIFRRMAAMCEAKGQRPPEDIHWRDACLLRYAGALRDAIAASDVLNEAPFRDTGARKLLATTRTAALLELWQATREARLVREADAAFRVAGEIDWHDKELQALKPLLQRAIGQAGLSDLAPARQHSAGSSNEP